MEFNELIAGGKQPHTSKRNGQRATADGVETAGQIVPTRKNGDGDGGDASERRGCLVRLGRDRRVGGDAELRHGDGYR